jgi:uncharacterized membrane protein
MPVEWQTTGRPDETRLHLWPHRSLTPAGFVWFLGLTAALAALPLITALGTPVLWFVLPFFALAMAGAWLALRRNQRDTEIVEILRLTRDQVTLTRHGPHGKKAQWDANPHWVKVAVHASGGPVPHYVTLRGNGREVEIGAFLSEAERQDLGQDLRRRLDALK